VRLETHKAVSFGDLVMNERIDHVDPPRGKAFGLPVAGVFEERDGKTSAWCDYFCMRQFSEGTGLTF
jgi:limonene-1,2-epoxide hydrolase